MTFLLFAWVWCYQSVSREGEGGKRKEKSPRRQLKKKAGGKRYRYRPAVDISSTQAAVQYIMIFQNDNFG
jgi:hypothetical protein